MDSHQHTASCESPSSYFLWTSALSKTGSTALSLTVLPKFPSRCSGFQTQKSGSSSGAFPSLAGRPTCVCAAWLTAWQHLGRFYSPLPGGADDRQACQSLVFSSWGSIPGSSPSEGLRIKTWELAQMILVV